MPDGCLTAEQLVGLLHETLAEQEQTALLQHLDGCAACQQNLERLTGKPDWLSSAARAGAPARIPPARLDDLITRLRSQLTSTPRMETAAERASPLHFLQPSNKPGVLGLLGSYEVIEEIDRGAMGIVFRARDTTLGRLVALKALSPSLAHDAAARARFLREARAAAAIAHEHVVTIHAVEETRAVPYLVMQLVAGRSLRERIAMTGPLRLEEVLRIGFQIASGLAAAHRLGLIHRDIKPSNILLENPVERVKITDFGLARAVDDTSLTAVGCIAGTPEYMAPEQARGEAVEQRADLFSLGCVLYEMTTGISPFRAPAPLVSLRKVCEEEPAAAHTVNPAVPEWMSRIIAGLLTKDPAHRFPLAAELAEQLNSRLHQIHQTAGPAGPVTQATRLARQPRNVFWPLATATAVIACGVVWWFGLHAKRQGSASAPGLMDRFIIPSRAGKPPQRFATLAEAVRAAPRATVIECWFNGELAMAPLVLEEPLFLRAAPEFKPVLVTQTATQPLLTTHASLVIEGLTFKAPAAATAATAPPPGARRAPPTATPLPGPSPALFIESTGAALMLANCRFLLAAQPSVAMPKGPTAIRLTSSAQGHFDNCAFFGPSGTAIVCGWDGPIGAARIVIRNCLHAGTEFVSLIIRTRMRVTLELWRNTVASRTLLHVAQSQETLPLSVVATNNVFDVEVIHQRDRLAPPRPLTTAMLEWKGSRNVLGVRTAFARLGPPDRPAPSLEVRSFADFRRALQIEAETSWEIPLGLFARLQNRVAFADQLSPADFGLSPEHLDLKNLGGQESADLGADLVLVGPTGYAEWRQRSALYQEWLDLLRAQGFAP